MIRPTAAAAAALAQAEVDPRAAVRRAQAVVAGDQGAHPAALAMAERALGLAHRHLRDMGSSTHHFERAVAVATSHGLRELAGVARMNLSGNLAEAGRFDEALDIADLAIADLDGHLAAQARFQKATIHMVRGNLGGAITGFDAALPVLARAGDTLTVAHLRANRGYVRLRRGEFDQAERDMEAALAIYEELGNERRAADALMNLGMAATLRGDLPLALQRFDAGDVLLSGLGVVDVLNLLHRADVLLAARLIEEAGEAIDRAVAGLAAEGGAARLVEAHLRQADVRLAAGDPAGAEDAVAAARELMTEQQRPELVPLADYTALRARLAHGSAAAGLLGFARRTAAGLDGSGLELEAADARLVAARLAAAQGFLPRARADLAAVRWARTTGPAWLQIAAWHATAEVRLAGGDTTGAQSALRAGLRRVDRHQATLGASDLRARAAELGAGLAAAGLRLAVGRGDPAAVFGWAERLRANGLGLRTTRPPRDAQVAAALAALRALAAEPRPETVAGVRERRRRQQRLETEITRLLRQGTRERSLTPPAARLPQVRIELGHGALVEYVESDGHLLAVVATAAGSRIVTLPGDGLEGRLTQLRFAAGRLARQGGSTASREAAAALFDETVRDVDGALLGPLAGRLGQGPLVVVPTGSLHLVPWGALPTLAGRDVSVSPSAALWWGASEVPDGGRVVLAAGPGLEHAAAEVAAIADLHPEAAVLAAADASAEAVLAAMDGAALVHLAAHGHFRADNPLFSALRLHGGRVHLCDVERLERPPGVVVLSACEAALAGRYAGDELMGLAAGFIGLGTRAVIASTLPVSDRHTRRLMVRFHALLQAGRGPAAALAAAGTEVAADSVEGRVTAGSFVCLGRG